jgi:hypothetical protein
MREVLRSQQSNSNGSGRFFFPPSVHTMGLLQGWEGYAIRVTDPQTDFAPECGGDLAARDMTAPNFWPIYLGAGEGGRPKYFPVVLISRGGSRRNVTSWKPMQREIGWIPSRHVAVIPVLQDTADCTRIEDSSLAEDCRLLNAYAAAMSLRENQDADSRACAEELCREVDRGAWSIVCQGRLNGFAMLQRARQFRGDYALTAGVPARQPGDLFPPDISGVKRLDGDMADDGSYGTGRRMYIGTYLESGPNSSLINVQLEEFPNAERGRQRLQELPGGFGDHRPGTVSEEEAGAGQKIERHRGQKQSGAFWVSGNMVVLINSSQPFPKADDFIAEYLRKFPSTL